MGWEMLRRSINKKRKYIEIIVVGMGNNINVN